MARIVTLKYGNKYSAEYVNILHNRIRHFNPNYEFVCFTENTNGIDPEVDCRPLDTTLGLYGWWFKLWIFNQHLEGANIFLDLDVLVTGSLACFHAPPTGVGIIRNGSKINSSCVTWCDTVPLVWSVFEQDRAYHLAQKPPYGDQEVLDLANAQGLNYDYFNEQYVSWLRVPREGQGARNHTRHTRLVICKGPRNPHQHLDHPLVAEHWRRI